MAKVAAPVLTLCLLLFGWQAVAAEEPPKVVVVTRDSTGVQTVSSRNLAPAYPTAVAGVSYTRGMSREQVGQLIRTAADTIPPEQRGCLVQSTGEGIEAGLLPRDLRSLSPVQMQWLAQRCQITTAQLAPIAAELLSSTAATAVARATAPAEPATSAATPMQQRLAAMRANASGRSSGPGWGTIALLALSVGGAMAAGIGLGQIIGRQRPPPRRPHRAWQQMPVAPSDRYGVSRPSGARLVGAPLPVELGKRYLPKPAHG